MPGTPFRIRADQVGGSVAVDGVDIPPEHILGWEVLGGPRDPTRFLLHIAVEGVVDGEGIVETIRDAASGDAVRRLDPKAVEDEALRRLTTSKGNLTHHRLEVVAEMLDGAPT
ncbi:MAG TPA: hypothetical protein VHK88_20240 [Aquihabitans sp.]|jgi:succinate dehydrogenase/fumarate reductase flavoprotein subunit|nr:hypothetical protein [Aquihabitans sp.]